MFEDDELLDIVPKGRDLSCDPSGLVSEGLFAVTLDANDLARLFYVELLGLSCELLCHLHVPCTRLFVVLGHPGHLFEHIVPVRLVADRFNGGLHSLRAQLSFLLQRGNLVDSQGVVFSALYPRRVHRHGCREIKHRLGGAKELGFGPRKRGALSEGRDAGSMRCSASRSR